jgi:hypothetical protein
MENNLLAQKQASKTSDLGRASMDVLCGYLSHVEHKQQ